jgi:two-component system, sensor histidine kinase and response regulator
LSQRKELVADAILKAQTSLDEALVRLQEVPAFDPGTVTFAAHTINNYLTVTLGALDLIQMRLGDQEDEQLQTWIESAQHAVNLMTRIAKDLMAANSPSEAKPKFEKFDLAMLVHRAVSFYQRLADRKTIRLISGSTIDVPLVWADRVMTAAVLDNLLSNAVKYSPKSTKVWVQVMGAVGAAICRVTDQGPGLSPEDQENLFLRGSRLTPQPTAGEISTGYGLAIAKELIEKLGGSIWCESVVGEGSVFAFQLPAYDATIHEPKTTATATKTQGEM